MVTLLKSLKMALHCPSVHFPSLFQECMLTRPSVDLCCLIATSTLPSVRRGLRGDWLRLYHQELWKSLETEHGIKDRDGTAEERNKRLTRTFCWPVGQLKICKLITRNQSFRDDLFHLPVPNIRSFFMYLSFIRTRSHPVTN